MILKNLIYIYQLENYDKKRFLLFVFKKINWFTLKKRNDLVWTKRSTLIFFLTPLIFILFLILSYCYLSFFLFLFFLILEIILLPFLIIFSDILIFPFVLFTKKLNIKKAKNYIEKAKKGKTKTIGITGSYGKTTMKNLLNTVLSEKYKIFSFPGNINTEIGVANYILKNKEKLLKCDILICEMGAYKIGDIEKLCNIINPDYSVTTAIGLSHLERFGSFENIVSVKFELANNTKKEAFLNSCDENVEKFADEKIKNKIKISKICQKENIKYLKYLENFSGISFSFENENFSSPIIADYFIDFIIVAYELSKSLNLEKTHFKKGLSKIEPVKHRLEVLKNTDSEKIVIDDSYNGNFKGFVEGINILQRAKGRKVVLTPGLVELGKKSTEIHRKIADLYIEKIDFVILIKNKNTEIIRERFLDKNFSNFKFYQNAKEAHDDLANVLKYNDTIIFQNDTTDNYL